MEHHSVAVHVGGGAAPVWVLGSLGAVGSFPRAGRQQMVLQLERLSKAAIRLQPLVLHCHQLLQDPL